MRKETLETQYWLDHLRDGEFDAPSHAFDFADDDRTELIKVTRPVSRPRERTIFYSE